MPARAVTSAAKRRVAIVVPCFNEAPRLRLDAFDAHASGHPDVGFVFVDDGSSDDTRAMIEAFRRDRSDRVSLVALDANRGKGEAVRLGLLAAIDSGAAIVGYWDADLATPLAAIDDLMAVLEARPAAEIVMGSRVLLLGRAIQRHALRHYVGRVFATAASMALGVPVYDTQCGAKVLRVTPATRALLEEPFRSRWAFDVELIARRLARRDAGVGEAIVEHPLAEWRDIAGSKVRPRDFVASLLDLWRIRRRYRRPD